MTTRRLGVGDYVSYGDRAHKVVAVGNSWTLAPVDGSEPISVLASDVFAALDRQSCPQGDSSPAQRRPSEYVSAQLSLYPKEVVKQARELEAHIWEMLSGYKAGAAASEDEQPTARYVGIPKLGDRERLKAEEIKALYADRKLSWTISESTLRRRRLAYFSEGGTILDLCDQRYAPGPPGSRLKKHAELVEVMRVVGLAEKPESGPGTFDRFVFRLERELEELSERTGKPAPELPSESTLRRLAGEIPECEWLMKTGRQKNATTPGNEPFTPKLVKRPGEIVEIDDTPIDVMVIDDHGNEIRVTLVGGMDVLTRSITAYRFVPVGGQNKIDAAMLLAQMLVPEWMRPGWRESLSARYMLTPFDRNLTLAQMFEGAAARPVIFPEAVQIDRNAAWLSRYMALQCCRRGISMLPARPDRGADKPYMEGGWSTVGTRFSQFASGYTGRNPTEKGANTKKKAVFTIPQLESLFAEFLIIDWQCRPIKGLTSPCLPRFDLRPNEAYGIAVEKCGFVQCPLGADAYMDMLPFDWLTADRRGFKHDERRYTHKTGMQPFIDNPGPDPLRPELWPVHYDPNDPTYVYVHNYLNNEWVGLPWRYINIVGGPFTDYDWYAACNQLVDLGRQPTEREVAECLRDLRGRMDLRGKELRRAQRYKRRLQQAARDAARAPRLPAEAVEDDEDPLGDVITVVGGTLHDYANEDQRAHFDPAALRSYGDLDEGLDDEEDY